MKRRPGGSLAGDAAMLTLGSLFTQAASILTLSVLARLVAKPQIGTYQQLSLFYGIVSPLLLGGIPAGLLFFLPRAKTDAARREWITVAFATLGVLGLASSVALALLHQPVAALLGGGSQLGHALELYSPYLFFAFIASTTPNALVAARRPVAAAVVNAAGGACTLVAAVGAALIRPDASTLAIGLSVGGAAWAAVSVGAIARSLGRPRLGGRGGDASGRELLRYGTPLAVSGIASRIGYQFDRIVVSATFTTSQFAVYALGAVEIPISLLLQNAVTSVLVPAMSTMWREGNVAGMLRLWRESTRKTALVIAPMFAFFMAFAPDVIRVLYGPGYHGSVGIFRIYLVLLPARITTWGVVPLAIGRTRVNVPAAIIMLVGNAAVALSLTGPLGLDGPALAAPVSALLLMAFYIGWTRRALRVSPREMVPWGRVGAIFATCGIAAAALMPLELVALPALVRLAVAVALFAPATYLALRALRLVSDDDQARLAGTLRRAGLLRRATVPAPVLDAS